MKHHSINIQEFLNLADEYYGDKLPLENIKFVMLNSKVMGILDYQGLMVTHILPYKESNDDREMENKLTEILTKKWMLEYFLMMW